ncbi:MAG TPA: lipoyl synthase [Chitinophagales bacterium]|nr:lipoyl synthase [Chitinophagales bacterium]
MIDLPVAESHHFTRKPPWLRVKLPIGENYKLVRSLVDQHRLHTICESGNCPNMGECWGAGTATFMILGNICTRSCGFCAVKTGKPEGVDWEEPMRVAEAVRLMRVKHCVLTSVDRDELINGGSKVWAATIRAVRELCPGTTIETLIPDFKGNMDSVDDIADEAPEVVSHNMETVRRLHPQVRPQAKYERSLAVIRRLKQRGMRTKSGVMAGLGETKEEMFEVMDDLLKAGCDVLTIGQYLQPTKTHLEVKEYVHPEIFQLYKEAGLSKGFKYVESGPLVRSSYHAERHVHIPKYPEANMPHYSCLDSPR